MKLRVLQNHHCKKWQNNFQKIALIFFSLKDRIENAGMSYDLRVRLVGLELRLRQAENETKGSSIACPYCHACKKCQKYFSKNCMDFFSFSKTEINRHDLQLRLI